MIDEVENRREPFAPNFESVVAVASAGIRKTARHTVRETAALGTAFPPFSRLVAEVTLLAEELRDRRLTVKLRDEFLAQRFVGGGFAGLLSRFFSLRRFGGLGGAGRRDTQQRRIVAADFVLVRVEAGRERRERGTTEGSGHVAARENGAAGSELVEVGRLDLWVSHKAVVGPPVVIGDDENNIGA